VFTSTFAAISCRAPFPRIILLEDRNKQFGQKRANGRIPMRDTTTNQERAFSASAPSLPRRRRSPHRRLAELETWFARSLEVIQIFTDLPGCKERPDFSTNAGSSTANLGCCFRCPVAKMMIRIGWRSLGRSPV